MISLIIGIVYVSSWVVNLVACAIGLVSQIIFSSLIKVAWCKFLLIRIIDEIVIYDISYALTFTLLGVFVYSIEYKTRYDFFFARKEEEYHKNYQKLLESMPVGIFILGRKNKEVLFYNKVISKLARIHNEKPVDSSNASEDNPITEKDIMDVIDSFKQKKGTKTLGELIRNWNAETFDCKYKYNYKKGGSKLVYTVKGLRLAFWSQDSEVFFIEDQTAFEELNKLESKYQKLYVASIVHDIRSPLNGVIGIIEKIDTLVEDQKVKDCVDVARKACQLLLFLTYDITDYSQLEAQKFKPNLKRVNIYEVLNEITELLSFNFKTKELGCNVIIKDAVPNFIIIDKHRYMQILLNILSNALKFTLKGSITIEVSYDSSNKQLITSVIDTGIGIKSEDIPQLFKLFGKLQSSSDINSQGVGFGLAICKKLSEQLGGSISAKSTLGVGSTFTFSVNANPGLNGTTSPTASTDERTTSAIELTHKMADHILKPNTHSLLDSLRLSSSKNLHIIADEMNDSLRGDIDHCSCNKILIVDDDPFNSLVLQNYLHLFNLVADEVIFSYIF